MTSPRPQDGLMQLDDVTEMVMPQLRLPRSVLLKRTLSFPTLE